MSESPSNHLIRSLTPRNILSFGPDTREIELRPLNVIIGTNGSGKSNLIEVINLMRASTKEWSEVTRGGGGVSEWIWKGDAKNCAQVCAVFTRRLTKDTLIHDFSFRAGQQRLYVDEEKIIKPSSSTDSVALFQTNFFDKPTALRHVITPALTSEYEVVELDLQNDNQSVLSQLSDPNSYPELSFLTRSYQSIKLYREWSFGRNTIFRQPQQAEKKRNPLEEDFSNLGLFLNRLKTEFPAAKRTFIKALQSLYGGITDFEVNISGGTVQVFLHEGDFAIPATRLSDGTLRYLCLLAILCDPEPPPLICIEEPELGLHPDILPGLADLLRAASERTQIIITTHSDILVDAMTETPECVLVCEKHEGKTEMTRLSSEDLSEWLKKYRLGQLWIDGQLGGKRW